MDLFEIMYQMVRQQYSDLETLGSESSLRVDNKRLYFIDKERETCQKISHNHPPVREPLLDQSKVGGGWPDSTELQASNHSSSGSKNSCSVAILCSHCPFAPHAVAVRPAGVPLCVLPKGVTGGHSAPLLPELSIPCCHECRSSRQSHSQDKPLPIPLKGSAGKAFLLFPPCCCICASELWPKPTIQGLAVLSIPLNFA